MPIKRRVFQLLEESQVPVTDKIFPWFVQTALVRVQMEQLEVALGAHAKGLALPQRVIDLLAMEGEKGGVELLRGLRWYPYRVWGLVLGCSLLAGLLGAGLVWKVGERNRMLIEHNQRVFDRCYRNFLPTKATKSLWFSCPGVQLPRSR